MQTPAGAADAAALAAHLQAHIHHPGVLAQFCETLSQSSLVSEDSALAFVPAIVATLRAHPSHAHLQANGCTLLGKICENKREDALSCAAGVVDGIHAVVDALRACCPADAELQSTCSTAIWTA
jgi:hypothetical protein